MEKRTFKLATPANVRRMTQERKPFYKHGEGLNISRLRSSVRWQKLREVVLCDNPLCAICQHPAVEVHHIKDAAKHEDLFFDHGNLVGLCEECHEKLHAAQKRGITIDILFPNLKRLMMDNNNLPELGLIDLDMLDFDFIPCSENDPDTSKYMKPKIHNRRVTNSKYAKDLAKSLIIDKNESVYVFLGGRFIFGDFIEAFIREHEIHILKLHIATLSMSNENVVSLSKLMQDGYVDCLDLHVSIYFYAHERIVMIPIIYELLDIGNKFQFTVSAIHAKICLMETEGGKKIIIHGSSNLRSSDNVEQIEITESEELYNFNRDFLDGLTAKYKTIKKPLRGYLLPCQEQQEKNTHKNRQSVEDKKQEK